MNLDNFFYTFQVVSLTPLNLAAAEVTASSVQLSWQRPESKLSHTIKDKALGNTQQLVMTRAL